MNDTLILKAKHFRKTEFESASECAIAKAAKEQFEVVEVNSSSTYLYVDYKVFYNISYDYNQFEEDKIIAASKGYSDEVIRKLELKKV